jgi:trans-2,3-dihydro-3-hydroxyanthranilate isomerase
MERHYVTVDVFTEQMFRGNPVAVVLDAEGLPVRSLSFPAARYHRRDLCVHTALSRPPSEAADRF